MDGAVWKKTMKIGELARISRMSVETLRFYEQKGLLPPPKRSEGNYRVYDKAHLERLRFIRHCRNLDMSLDETRALLKFVDTPQEDCGEVNTLLEEHIRHVSERIRELRFMERQLKALRQQCAKTGSTEKCAILATLSAPGLEEDRRRNPPVGVHQKVKSTF
jgi:Cd(II)/Pb(II)-responsive transcriptional regulator